MLILYVYVLMPHVKSCPFFVLVVLFTVVPKVVNFTSEPSLVHVGDDLIATCCASGNPPPILAINGMYRSTSFIQNMDNYEGCASITIDTSGVDAGTNLTTSCQVTLAQNFSCNIGISDGKHRVIERVMDRCLVALADASENITNKIIGK